MTLTERCLATKSGRPGSWYGKIGFLAREYFGYLDLVLDK